MNTNLILIESLKDQAICLDQELEGEEIYSLTQVRCILFSKIIYHGI